MKTFAITILVFLLTGCEKPRNSVGEQIMDYRACQEAGMNSYPNLYGEILCQPPRETCHD